MGFTVLTQALLPTDTMLTWASTSASTPCNDSFMGLIICSGAPELTWANSSAPNSAVMVALG